MADNIKILVVDDEPLAIKTAERAFKTMGYDVEGALSGKEAVLKMEQGNYTLVITDLKMPEMDGLALTRWIKKSRPDTGIIITSDYPSQETIKEALELGVIDYVAKPLTPETLMKITNRALEWMGKGVSVEKKFEEEFTPHMMEEINRIINNYRNRPGNSIPVLQHVQEAVGYLPPFAQKMVARGLNVSLAEIHSIVSFYSFFTMKPRGKHPIKVCLGTACYVKGIEAVLDKIKETLKLEIGGITNDRLFSLESVRCLGACGLAPVMVIQDTYYGSLTAKKAMEAVNQYVPAGIKAAPAEVEVIEEKEG